MRTWREWLVGLAPPLLVLILLALASGYAVYWRFYAEQAADERALREWLEEARVFRKTLPELAREYLQAPWPEHQTALRQELADQLAAMATPLRQYPTHLPLFPTVYRIELHLRRAAPPGTAIESPFADGSFSEVPQAADPSPTHFENAETLAWNSGLAFTPQGVRRLEHVLVQDALGEARAVVWYQLHAFHHQQRLLAEQQRFTWGIVAMVIGFSFLALAWVLVYSWRQRIREHQEAGARQRLEEARRLALEHELRRQEAEQQALQLRSQMFASMAILAGSYAHNIKNLLVRPNALLRQCLEQPLDDHLRTALKEVEATLDTVTDRLQEILRTVRRDPTAVEKTTFDLNELAHEVYEHWNSLADARWKVVWRLQLAQSPMIVFADRSQLVQAVENLIFNARDAIFEKRVALRQQAHQLADQEIRKQALLQAIGWRGEILLATYSLPASGKGEVARDAPALSAWAVLEVRDNGIGMTQEVLQRCTEPYFTTKRQSVLYEGQATGVGLGLSFVRTIMEQHGGRLEIDSTPQAGTCVRLLLPLSTDHPAKSPEPHYSHTPP